ncbi:hypothetical protein R50072_21450 [Simiduia litorea]|uniref:outer membrane beta-barrel protein n=1 Tax=Simiduia litorea TaxID=1435348 RepID=UPI0036F44067
MFTSNVKIAALGIALVSMANVFAEPNTDSGFSIGIDAGRADAHDSCDRLIDCDNSDTSTRIDVGYDFNRVWSAEFGYTSFGTLFDSHDNNLNASQEANAWTLSGIASLPLGERFSAFGRLGVARYETNNSGTVQGVPVKNDSDLKPYLGAGVNFYMSQHFALRGEFQYYADLSGVDGSKDDVQALYAGVTYHF